MIIKFKKINLEEYKIFKDEIKKLFPYTNIKRNKQNYALGGFNIIPKNHEEGFKPFEIEEISKYLKNNKLDSSSLDILKNKVYGKEQGEFTGTKMNHIIFKDGFYYLYSIENYEEIKKEVLK